MIVSPLLSQNYSFQDLLHNRFKEIDLFRKLPTVKVVEVENIVEAKCAAPRKNQPKTPFNLYSHDILMMKWLKLHYNSTIRSGVSSFTFVPIHKKNCHIEVDEELYKKV